MEYSLEELNNHVTELNILIQKYDALLRLKSNPDFKNLILEDYCSNACTAYIEAYTSNSLTNELSATRALEAAKSTGYLKQFFNLITINGLQAKEELQETLNKIHELEKNSYEGEQE